MNRRLVNTGRDKVEFQVQPIPEAPPSGAILKVFIFILCIIKICMRPQAAKKRQMLP